MAEPYKNLSVNKLLENLAYLKMDESFIDNSRSDNFAETIDNLFIEGCSHFIIDLSEINFLDSGYVSVLLSQMKMLSIFGGSLRVIVLEDKPRLKFSIKDSVSDLSLFLSKETALLDFFN